jgi:hypothetical protein
MRAFSIEELSAVDKPAQAHARMAIMKRADEGDNDDMRFEKIIDRPLAFDSFEAAVEHLKMIHRCSGTEAMRKAAEAHPRLLEAYRKTGAVSYRPDFTKAAPAKAVQEWDIAVAGVMERDGVSRTAAMSRVRSERPHLYDAYQRA